MTNDSIFGKMATNLQIALVMQLCDAKIITSKACIGHIDHIIDHAPATEKNANDFAAVQMMLFNKKLINVDELIVRLGMNRIIGKNDIMKNE